MLAGRDWEQAAGRVADLDRAAGVTGCDCSTGLAANVAAAELTSTALPCRLTVVSGYLVTLAHPAATAAKAQTTAVTVPQPRALGLRRSAVPT